MFFEAMMFPDHTVSPRFFLGFDQLHIASALRFRRTSLTTSAGFEVRKSSGGQYMPSSLAVLRRFVQSPVVTRCGVVCYTHTPKP